MRQTRENVKEVNDRAMAEAIAMAEADPTLAGFQRAESHLREVLTCWIRNGSTDYPETDALHALDTRVRIIVEFLKGLPDVGLFERLCANLDGPTPSERRAAYDAKAKADRKAKKAAALAEKPSAESLFHGHWIKDRNNKWVLEVRSLAIKPGNLVLMRKVATTFNSKGMAHRCIRGKWARVTENCGAHQVNSHVLVDQKTTITVTPEMRAFETMHRINETVSHHFHL